MVSKIRQILRIPVLQPMSSGSPEISKEVVSVKHEIQAAMCRRPSFFYLFFLPAKEDMPPRSASEHTDTTFRIQRLKADTKTAVDQKLPFVTCI